MNSTKTCCPRALKAVMNTLLGNKRAVRQRPVKWQQKQEARRALSVVAKKAPRGEDEAEEEAEEGAVGEQIDLLLTRVDERWSLVQEPQHMRGVLQTLRRCNVLSRLLPRGKCPIRGRDATHNTAFVCATQKMLVPKNKHRGKSKIQDSLET